MRQIAFSMSVVSTCALSASVLGACDSSDVGKYCEARPAEPLPAEPVVGEQPVNEIVSVQRNSECESFQCLSHGGYHAYCTESCKYDSGTVQGICTTNADCRRPLHCFQGFCQDDSCPSGFECREVQEAGPLAGQLFCVQKEGCGEPIDCEALGDMTCAALGCFDANLRDPSAEHALTCVDAKELSECACQGLEPGDFSCVHPVCNPPDTATSVTPAWPEGSCEYHHVCVRKDP